MAHEILGRERNTTSRNARQWTVVAAVIAALVGVPTVVLAEFQFGLLTSLGITGNLGFGLVVMIPGFALGALSLVVMLGT